MNKDEAKKVVTEYLNEQGAVKATKLFADIRMDNDEFDLVELVDEMVDSGEIIELEYVSPTSVYRIRSLYLPKGTLISVNFVK